MSITQEAMAKERSKLDALQEQLKAKQAEVNAHVRVVSCVWASLVALSQACCGMRCLNRRMNLLLSKCRHYCTPEEWACQCM